MSNLHWQIDWNAQLEESEPKQFQANDKVWYIPNEHERKACIVVGNNHPHYLIEFGTGDRIDVRFAELKAVTDVFSPITLGDGSTVEML